MANEVVIHIRGDTRQAEKSFQDLTRTITGISNTVTNLIAGGILARIGQSIIGSAMEAQQVTAQLNATLRSTGGIAGVTAEAAEGLAASLSVLSGMDDEAVLSGQNLLLTFTNIHANVFPAATRAALDMATAMKGGVPSAEEFRQTVLQVGKALQDPVEGVTALQRVGVRLSEGQKELIKTMMESNDVAGAQALILQELQTEFGGSAEAAGKTFAGELGRAKTALGDMQEEIGSAVLPTLGILMKAFADHLPNAIQTARVSLERLRAIFLYSLSVMADEFGGFLRAFKAGWNALGNIPALSRIGDFLFGGPDDFFGPEWTQLPLIGGIFDKINASKMGISDETDDALFRLAERLRAAAKAQIDLANSTVETTAAFDELEAFAKQGGRYSVGGPSLEGGVAAARKAAADAAREAARIERETLTIPKLMDRAFPKTGTARLSEGFEIIPPETLAILQDWDRQVTDFTRDSAILLDQLDRSGTLGAEDAVKHLNAILTAWQALPPELQDGMAEVESNLKEMLSEFQLGSDGMVDMTKRNADAQKAILQELHDTALAIQQSLADTYKFNLEREGKAQREAAEEARRLGAAQESQLETARQLRLERERENRQQREARDNARDASLREYRRAERAGFWTMEEGEEGEMNRVPDVEAYRMRRSPVLILAAAFRQALNEVFGGGIEITRDGRLKLSVERARTARLMGAGGLA